MTAAFKEEFLTVDAVVRSEGPTAQVDAFSLALIKAERQMRKLFTNLIYQSEAFDFTSISEIKTEIGIDRELYFEHFEIGYNKICFRATDDLIGKEYVELRGILKEATRHRNKIFHGQLTLRDLGVRELRNLHSNIRCWCDLLASGAEEFVGYDGFLRDSFRKNKKRDVLKEKIDGIADLKTLISDIKRASSAVKKLG
jgi:hypothetical protein